MADANRVYQFIKTYAEEHSVSLPGRIPGFKRDDMLLPPSSTLRAKCIDTYVPAVKLQVQVLCFLKYMLTDVLQISKDAFFSFFFFLFNRFNFFAEMYSPSGKRNAELFCSSFFCLVLVDFVFLAAVCLGLLCTILKPFTAFSEHFLTECRTLHLHLSIQRLRIGLCHSVNDPVMIWFMSLSFSHHSLIFFIFFKGSCAVALSTFRKFWSAHLPLLWLLALWQICLGFANTAIAGSSGVRISATRRRTNYWRLNVCTWVAWRRRGISTKPWLQAVVEQLQIQGLGQNKPCKRPTAHYSFDFAQQAHF